MLPPHQANKLANQLDFLDSAELTPSWFNQLLQLHGLQSEVTALSYHEIGTGQIGKNLRINFEPEGLHTQSLVGKFPSDNESSRATGKLLGHYRREPTFYNHFSDLVGLITPDLYAADYRAEQDQFYLIMEDMKHSTQGDQFTGCNHEQAQLAIKSAAVLHAKYWCDDSLHQYAWLEGTNAAPAPLIGNDFLVGLWEGFVDRYQGKLSAVGIRSGETLTKHLDIFKNNLSTFALTHGDYRLDNMLFAHDSKASKALAVVDWQTVGIRHPALDIAYFIGAAFKSNDRKHHEAALLDLYIQELSKLGINSYKRDQLQRDYQWYSYYGISVAFAAAMLVERTPRGDQLFLTMLERHATQIEENQAWGIFDEGI